MATSKLFDQMVDDNSGRVPTNIEPNQRFVGEVVFEPIGSGVRVTGRTEEHELLWGMVCSKGMLEQPHASVAIYGALREEVQKALAANDLPTPEKKDSVDLALRVIERMEQFLAAAKEKITVKKISAVTKARATTIAKVINDAHQMATLELPFVGAQGKNDEE